VELPLLLVGVPADEARERSVEMLRRGGLAGRERHPPRGMSGGEQQRVTVARALVARPAIVWADEPTGNLDSKTGQSILALFDELVEQGKTVLMVTHDPTVAHRCHRVIRLHDGSIQSDERNARRQVLSEAGQLSPQVA